MSSSLHPMLMAAAAVLAAVFLGRGNAAYFSMVRQVNGHPSRERSRPSAFAGALNVRAIMSAYRTLFPDGRLNHELRINGLIGVASFALFAVLASIERT